MKTSRLFLVALLVWGVPGAVGCDDDGNAAGTAPTIANLTHDATTLEVGQDGLIQGRFDFTDPDGDVDIMQMDLVTPSGQPGVVPDTQLTGMADLTAGSVNWSLTVTPPEAGTYDLVLRVVDLEGNVSNELQTTFDAQ